MGWWVIGCLVDGVWVMGGRGMVRLGVAVVGDGVVGGESATCNVNVKVNLDQK